LAAQDGSFTLEASIVFPAILLLVIMLTASGMYMDQKASQYYDASAAARRASDVWDNSHRDPVTGQVEPGQYDPLYWRMTDDWVLERLFGWRGEGAEAVYELGRTEPETLPERKMERAAASLSDGANGVMRYANEGYRRRISAALTKPFPLPIGFARRVELSSVAAANVAEPVEFIRSIELIRSYAGRWFGNEQRADPADVREILRHYSEKLAR
jgi:hypothetical protein